MIFVRQPVAMASGVAPQPGETPGKSIFSGWRRFVFIAVAAIVGLAITLQLGLGAVMAGRVMPGVSVAGIEIGGLTRPEAARLLRQAISEPKAKLQINGVSHIVTAEQIGMTYDVEQTLDEAFQVGRDQSLLPMQLWSAYHHSRLTYAFRLEPEADQPLVKGLVAAQGQPARDAAIVIKDGIPVVEADVSGLSLDATTLRQSAAKQLASLSGRPVTLRPTVQQAHIRAADVAPAVEATKALLKTPITITYENNTFQPTPAQMGAWIAFQKSPKGEPPALTPIINPDGVKHYLQSLAVKINVNPVNRKLHIQNGDTQEVQVGQDGLQLDQDTLAGLVAKAVTAKQPLITAAPTVKVPFKTEYNRTVSLDYGKYIEVNLSLQRLWVYQDHKVIYESPLTSGAVGAGFPTVTGLFSIQAKQQNRNLNGYAIGYNYNVFVKYWMPFYGNYGLHDASWRGNFGGQDYYYGGSHGCVNLPEATAAFLYGWADVGTPVWVHP